MSKDLNLIHPKLRKIVRILIGQCEDQGLPILITDGFRTQSEQDRLYNQGRTTAGIVVTNVKWPDSAHNWGVAVDFCRNVKGREYDDSDNFFEKVAMIGKKLGLEWGGDWNKFVDKPHLQLPEYMPGNNTRWLKTVYRSPDVFRGCWNDDVPSEWARDACEWAVEQGIIKGDENGEYHWQDALTLERFCQILYNMR